MKALLVTIVCSVVMSVAMAQDTAPKRQSAAEKREAIMKEFDADGDGTLSPDEKKAMKEAKKKQHMEKRKARRQESGKEKKEEE